MSAVSPEPSKVAALEYPLSSMYAVIPVGLIYRVPLWYWSFLYREMYPGSIDVYNAFPLPPSIRIMSAPKYSVANVLGYWGELHVSIASAVNNGLHLPLYMSSCSV